MIMTAYHDFRSFRWAICPVCPAQTRDITGLGAGRGRAAGALVQGAAGALVEGEVVGAGIGAGELLAALHEQVVERAAGADGEVAGGHPAGAGGPPPQARGADGVLGRPAPAGTLDAAL